MNRFIYPLLIVSLSSQLFASPENFLQDYCISCHGEEKQKGKVRLDHWGSFSPELISQIIDQLEFQDMPPEDEKQPSSSETTTFLKHLKQGKKSTSATTSLRRFNLEEYRHTVLSLLELPDTSYDPTHHFPPDTLEQGQAKQGELLQTTEFFLRALMKSSEELINRSLHFYPQPKAKEYHSIPLAQNNYESKHVRKQKKFIHLYNQGYYSYDPELAEGLEHDGLYKIQIKAESLDRQNHYEKYTKINSDVPARIGLSVSSLRLGPSLHRNQNGSTQLAEYNLKENRKSDITHKAWLYRGDVPRLNYSNGVLDWRTIGFRIIRSQGVPYRGQYIKENEFQGQRTINLFPEIISNGIFPKIRVHSMTVSGPHYDIWPPRSHRKWFDEQMVLNPESSDFGIHRFARAAFRRNITDREFTNLKALKHQALKDGLSLEDATKEVFKAILCMPDFIYLFLKDEQNDAQKKLNLLQAMLWSQPLKIKTSPPNINAKLVDNMLNDKRSQNFVEGFLHHWLQLNTLGHMAPDKQLFPSYYVDNLQAAMKKETELMFLYCLRNNLSITNFINSDFTFVNRDLCRHYGIDPNGLNWNETPKGLQNHELYIKGQSQSHSTRFAMAKLYDHRRGGLLGHASVLTLTSNGIDTNPILRGVWFLKTFLGQRPKLPNEDVPELEPDIRGSKTIREQLEKHRASPQCSSCHNKIDPPGFVLENFDPIGQWRYVYPNKSKTKVESHSEMFGKSFNDIVEFKQLLMSQQDTFAKALVKHMLSYALGRDIKVYDDTHIEQILKASKVNGYRLKDILMAIVQSPIFLDA